MILSQEWKEARWDKFVRECHELCASNPVHAVSDAQASKRSPNIMANRLRVQRDKQGENHPVCRATEWHATTVRNILVASNGAEICAA